MGKARSDVLDEVVYEALGKKHFHSLIDTAFIWLSKLSWKEKPLTVPTRKSDLLGKTPGGTFRFEEHCHGLKSSYEPRMMRKDILEKRGTNVQLVTAEYNTREFLWNHTTYLL